MNRFKDGFIKLLKKIRTSLVDGFNKLKDANIEEPSVPHKNLIDSIKERDRKDIFFNINVFLTAIRGVFGYLIAAMIVASGLTLGIGIGYVVSVTNQQEIPTYDQMKSQLNDTASSTSLYFANDVKLGNVQSDLVRKKISFNEMSPYLKKAIVATEDSYFYRHNGVVPKSVVRAAFSDVGGVGSANGGSTLTQQTVKMQLLTSETTWRRKATEILLSMRIDKYFSKNKILETYLNAATFGHNNKGENIGGAEMAAQGLFGVSAKDLSLPQAAFIAGLPQSPSVYTPYDEKGNIKKDLSLGMKRKDTVLFRMYRNKKITKAEYQAAKKVDLKSQFLSKASKTKEDIPYDYVYNLLSDKVRTAIIKNEAKKDGIKYSDIIKNKDMYSRYYQQADTEMKQKHYRVDSTINKDMYDNMQTVAQQYSSTLGTAHTTYATDPVTGKTMEVHEPVQNGSVVIDNNTGAVLSFVGGVNYEQSQLNHAFSTKRSPGSSIKPLLVFGPAVENGVIGTKTMLADFKTSFGGYKPTDYGKTIQNRFISAQETLQNSYNIPTLHLFDKLNKSHIDANSYMKKMGVGLTQKESDQLGTALGGLDNGYTVEQQASAFSTFANKGTHVNSYVVDKITDPSGKVIYQHHKKKKKVFSKGTSYIMQQMLKSVVTKGTASSLVSQLDFDQDNFFGKTGTSNDYRDNWFVGSTPGVTISSWIGYDNFYGNNFTLGSNATSVNQAYWAKIANAVNDTDPFIMEAETTFKRPASVKSVKVNSSTGTKAGTIDYNGSSYASTIPANATSLYYKSGVKNLSENNFAIGGSKDNYSLFWNHYFGYASDYGVISGKGADSNDAEVSLYRQQSQTTIKNSDNAVAPNTNNTQSNNTSGNNIADDTTSGSGTGGSGSGSGSGNDTNNGGNDNGGGSTTDPGTGNGNSNAGGNTGTGQSQPE